MTTINETVSQAMQNAGLSGYNQHVEPVVTALVNREQEIVGHLIRVTRESDLDTEQVTSVLRDAGLHMPEIQAAATPTSTEASGSVEQMLANIQQTLAGLTEFARNHGFNG